MLFYSTNISKLTTTGSIWRLQTLLFRNYFGKIKQLFAHPTQIIATALTKVLKVSTYLDPLPQIEYYLENSTLSPSN